MTLRLPKKNTSHFIPETKVTIKILEKNEREEAEKYWTTLEKQTPNTPLVCNWDWVNTWIKHYGDIVDHWFCVGISENEVVGIAIITKEAKRWLPIPVSAYHLGTQGEPLKDWIHMVNNNVLAKESHYQDFIDSLADVIIKKFSWEAFLLDDANTSFSTSMMKSFSHYPYPIKEVIAMCNIVDLEAIRKSGKTVMEQFSHDTRYQIRRNLKEFEDLEIEYAESLPQALSILEELIPLHQETMTKKGKRGSFSSDRFTAFHNDIIRKMFHTDAVILFRVKSKRLGTIGCFYLFNDNGTAFGYLAGLNDFSKIDIETINSKRLKPGFVMHALCMQACVDKGLNEYHFSVGNEPYKNELAGNYKTLVTLKIQKTYKAKIRETMFESYIKAEEAKKFQHLLKPVYAAYLLLNK